MGTTKGLRSPRKCRVWLLLRKRGASEILASLASGKMSFNELKKELDVSANTLSSRLQELGRSGIVEPLFIQKSGRVYKKYRLTDNGVSLVSNLKQMLRVLEKSFLEKGSAKAKGMPSGILKE